MKIILSFLFSAALCVPAFAGQLIDSANIFGPRAADVASTLASLPVSIETRVSTPAEGLKVYADSKAERNNFYVVITTQPRGWRISMNPVGLASSESVRIAGDHMSAKFRQGDFAGGAIGLARELEKLTHPVSAVYHAAPVASVATPVSSQMDETLYWFLWIAGGCLGFVIICALIIWFINWRNDKKEAKRRQEAFNSKAAAYMAGNPKLSKSEQAKAREQFDSYTPEQRERISVQYVNHPYYHSSILNDPFMFYWFMTTINQPHYGYANPGYGYAAPASPPVQQAEPSSGSSWFSSPSSSSSSSDSSGASSSYEAPSSPSYDSGSSGGSSFDSGSSSSSDSSGGGGSW